MTDPATLKTQATLLLAELAKGDPDRRVHAPRPDGAHLVADALLTLGHLDDRHRGCVSCPVALYLLHGTGLRWAVYQSMATVKFSSGARVLDYAAAWLPAAVSAFVHAFDRREYDIVAERLQEARGEKRGG